MKKVLVTGGCGFIGSNLSKALLKENLDVVVVDNLTSARKDFMEFLEENPKIDFVSSCFASQEILNRIQNKEFDTVFHVAAIPRVVYSVEHPHETTDVNVSRTVKLLEACTGNIKRFIFSSSSSVYGGAENLPTPVDEPKDPKSPYAWQKSCIEDVVKVFSSLYNLDVVSLRYFNVFGPGQFGDSAYATAVSAWCHAIKENTALRSDGSGDQSRDMCYVDNVVDANILAMKYNKKFNAECYNVACGDRVSNNEVLDFLKEKYPEIKIETAPFRLGDVMHTLADISKTEKDLGYSSKIRFWDGLEKTLHWWNL